MSGKIVFSGGTLIDGTGASPLEDSILLIEGSKIAHVGRHGKLDIPSGSKIIDIVGKTVMPGLIDAHVHLHGVRSHRLDQNIYLPDGLKLIRAVNDVGALLDSGYTTCRDCGGVNAVYLRDAISEGTIIGPRILASVYNLSPTFGHSDKQYLPEEWSRESNPGICDGVTDCIRAVRSAFRAGADFIKVSASGGVAAGPRDSGHREGHSVKELKAIVEEAKRFGSFVAAHAQGSQGIKNAVTAGVRTIEHGDFIDDEGCRMMAENGTILVSTLSITHQIAHGPRTGEYAYPEWSVEIGRQKITEAIKNTKRAYETGVILAAASDFDGGPLFKMGTNAMELKLLVEECGLKPTEAIISATKNAAKACGLENEIGTLEEGKKADIIVVDGDPLKDISVLRSERIPTVLKDGVVCKMIED